MTMALRVLVCDDELVARKRASRLLAEQPDIEVVAECASGEEVLDKLTGSRGPGHRPMVSSGDSADND